MDTSIWGPGLWTALHCMTFNYPETPNEHDKEDHEEYLKALSKTLPCMICRQHCKAYLLEHPPALSSRAEFIRWMVDFHNAVNTRLDKPVWELEDVYKTYELYRAHPSPVTTSSDPSSHPKQTQFILSFIILLLMTVLAYVCTTRRK